MRTIRRLLCVVLAVSMLCAAAIPALAEITLEPGSTTMYLNCKNGKGHTTLRNININGINMDSKITDPKSSKPSVLNIDSLLFSKHTQQYFPGDSADFCSATLSVLLHKPGKSTVSVVVDGKTYKTKLTVNQYVNPIKSFVITSVSGKNVKSLFNTTGSTTGTLTSDTKAGQVRLTTAKGWKITKIAFISIDDAISYERKTGDTTVKLPIPAMKKGGLYTIGMTFKNIATGGIIDGMYLLR